MRKDKALLAGLGLALATALISGFAIFMNSYASKEFDSATVFTTLKNGVVGVALIAFVLQEGRLREVGTLRRGHLLGLIAIAMIGGSVPFVLFFEGLQQVESGNAAFIHKTLFLWVAFLAVLMLRERVGLAQLAALAVLLLAQILIAGPGALGVGIGEGMVFAATLFWAVETAVARRLLPDMSSSLAATARMAGGSLVLVAYVLATGKGGAMVDLSAGQWGWVLLTGVVLLAYVTSWYAALKRAPATAVTAVLTIGAPVTALLNVLDGRPLPAGDQMLGYALILLGAGVIGTILILGRRATTRLPVPVPWS